MAARRSRLSLAVPSRAPRPFPRWAARNLRRIRVPLADGAKTTVWVAEHRPGFTDVRVVRFPRPTPLEAWCRRHGVQEAIVGGFFVRPSGTPLGELRTRGIARDAVPFDEPWGALRACVHVAAGKVRIARRRELPGAPAGDLLQAGPLLVRDGEPVSGDEEGFSPGAHQFDSDITEGRYPRAALATTRDGTILAVACDGRADREAGMTLGELSEALVAVGAVQAINLDGGGSTSLVCGGRLRNRPREEHGIELAGGRPISTAIVFTTL
jgi:phosphodiester glycosidase